MSSENCRLLHIILISLNLEITLIFGKSVSKEYPEPIGDLILQSNYYRRFNNEHEFSRSKREIIDEDRFRNKLWDLPIKYKLDPSFDAKSARDIQDAMKLWEKDTCLKFEHIQFGELVFVHHLLVSKGDSCSSDLGRILSPLQVLRLSTEKCQPFFGFALHQLGHVLGFVHEQNRGDSRDYVTIHSNNIIKASSYEPLFQVWPNPFAILTYGLPYDYGSIMHYPGNQYAKPGKITIEANDPLFQQTMGQRTGLSFYDTKIVNLAYCEGSCETKLDCKKGGITNPKNCNVCICPDGYGGTLCEGIGPNHPGCSPNSNTVIRVSSSQEHCLESPQYGSGGYDIGSQCNWILQAPEGRQIQMRFSGEFGVYIYDAVSCFHWVEIKCKGDLEKMGPRFCGLNIPKTILTSEGNEAVISFRSNYDAPISSRIGFKLCYKLKSNSGSDSHGDSNKSDPDDNSTDQKSNDKSNKNHTKHGDNKGDKNSGKHGGNKGDKNSGKHGNNKGDKKSVNHGEGKGDKNSSESLSNPDNTDKSCPKSFVFSVNATSCPSTCAYPNEAKKCKIPPKPGCTCPNKKIIFQNKCVYKKKCKCIDHNGDFRNRGESWLSTNCKERTTCRKRGQINVKKKLKCLHNQKCVVEKGNGKCIDM